MASRTIHRQDRRQEPDALARPSGSLRGEPSNRLPYRDTRLHAYQLAESHGEAAHGIIERIALVELAPPVVERALDEFPCPVRTLDALHLATFYFLWRQGQPIELASYDHRMLDAARAMGLPVLDVRAI